MKKPQGYDEAIAITGEFVPLPPGGYVCVIKKAMQETTKTGKEVLVLLVDIAEGEYKGYFQKSFDSNTKQDKKWPNGARVRQFTEGNSTQYFKGLITCIEKSNPGYVGFDANGILDENKLSGKKIGCIFGRRQYPKRDGTLAFETEVFYTRSTSSIVPGLKPPEDRLWKGNNQSSGNTFGEEVAFEEINFDDNNIVFM